jgi:hypothetical protein
MSAPDIAPEYADAPIRLKPGDRLHRLVAILADTWYDDLTDDRIAQLEALAQSWRWMGADARRLNESH